MTFNMALQSSFLSHKALDISRKSLGLDSIAHSCEVSWECHKLASRDNNLDWDNTKGQTRGQAAGCTAVVFHVVKLQKSLEILWDTWQYLFLWNDERTEILNHTIIRSLVFRLKQASLSQQDSANIAIVDKETSLWCDNIPTALSFQFDCS